MRHNKSFNHLGRQTGHRSAMLSNMATSLILHKRISTTVAKAKALKVYVEPLITKSKVDSTHSRRVVFSYLQNKESVTELFRDVALKVANRPGGYTRILKTGNRIGDNAEMCIIELVDYNQNYTQENKSEAKTASKRRRGTKKKSSEDAAPTITAAKTVEAVKTAPVVNDTVTNEASEPEAEVLNDDKKDE
ncbi:MAG TPA: 50S ribosomal protein L17 [Marinilabiliales bacterium]|nr:MAG: 50S ribosomal protein L17 [Bacteroidetes bacterium GWA2_40_14]OFX62609.1 MAG: 50S ribosomal protein L17 [Bacteroidetes bacterium GWC2_40_13]OFX74395.1 MAG: 50S ribosomal protein L17 [Bacteroidetes bacterium GWD2_40_43]OFX95192.1 MAG: 50S ribosomal protein L17 [Bacteroidetes bacterium GWE2_40_63]OFY21084.1 MAG: 50S ribosomal protein L17 [Bacteroidetes bacterium GWF2_40_13]OFZ30858.1 MAG: 50S ribosomal protein L17 [Bacteroidetes bacterium RIFOXYC2_FULL_40_12]HAM97348.1 50S ribosomal pro